MMNAIIDLVSGLVGIVIWLTLLAIGLTIAGIMLVALLSILPLILYGVVGLAIVMIAFK